MLAVHAAARVLAVHAADVLRASSSGTSATPGASAGGGGWAIASASQFSRGAAESVLLQILGPRMAAEDWSITAHMSLAENFGKLS